MEEVSCPICGQDHTTVRCPNEWKVVLNTTHTDPINLTTFGSSPFVFGSYIGPHFDADKYKQNEISKENRDKWK